MRHSSPLLRALTALVLVSTVASSQAAPAGQSQRLRSHDDLVRFFTEWRQFQRPKLVDGVPDYTAPAMTAQYRALTSMKRRLAAFDTTGWSVAQQVDYQVVRAEMNGLDFDHRVLKPWANNPAYYVTVFSDQSDQPAREGPFAYGSIELWSYAYPLSAGDAATIEAGMRAIPPLLAQARTNLVGDQRDIWHYGIGAIRDQSGELARFAERLTSEPASLRASVAAARAATDSLVTWLEARASRKTGASGIGIANYDWYLKHVMLVPYSWADEVLLMQRELARSHSFLALEELRNARLPKQDPIATAGDFDRRFGASIAEYLDYLREHDLYTVKPWMDQALRERLGRFSSGPLEFFHQVDYRDPVVMRTHGYHWFDLGFMKHEPHANPIRRGPLLYNIFISRTEGHATGWEEQMLQAGMFDARPRSRELIYILLAQRAARALGDLRMHANQATLEQAAEFTVANVPRGWLSIKGNLVRFEQHLYLQQPGYGTSYVIGKLMLDRLLMRRRQQLGESFSMRQYMAAFDAVGLVPASLVEWEMTGELRDDVRKMLRP
ncbi:MAG: DUF885 family protein [Gemmatimonadetes bacterium]|nr:DUF885 family protein [Gemmatimonadota bacterium]MCC7324264.1 DUF885 family protein [Gemmatimonadaceae bacterium]MBK8060272.1 DUF885 family protein [Gemmatimonadota bacterium]MBK8648196.1 DUF885 family protein [Gemmatimonadota bacterium]MBK9977108.1 DUF885 family protein [Gemmatimonadota bacterium]